SVINLRHQFVQLDEINRRLLVLLDGKRNHAELLEGLRAWHTEGLIDIQDEDGSTLEDATLISKALEQVLRIRLERLAQVGLLAR
ncbi:MAG: hypothetical protein ACE5FI_17225, partial [Anaerolineales bacterium]